MAGCGGPAKRQSGPRSPSGGDSRIRVAHALCERGDPGGVAKFGLKSMTLALCDNAGMLDCGTSLWKIFFFVTRTFFVSVYAGSGERLGPSSAAKCSRSKSGPEGHLSTVARSQCVLIFVRVLDMDFGVYRPPKPPRTPVVPFCPSYFGGGFEESNTVSDKIASVGK